ncbi:Methyl-CpG-binding domain protein 4 [Xylographa pallens]|nr:Methyl-CpG-binding domain protein 4 [Xylographa pallens]
MSEDGPDVVAGNPGLPATYHGQTQNAAIPPYRMALEIPQNLPPALSVSASHSGSSRLSSPLSDFARSPSLSGSLLLEEAEVCSADEPSDRVETALFALLKDKISPYPYTDFKSFVPPALDSHRPVIAGGGSPSSSIAQTSLAITDLLSSKVSPSVCRTNISRTSRFFPKAQVKKISCIPFPALNATSFGLVQERLCHEPFRLLVAVMFLNKTRGKVALPVCYDLFARYPSPEDLASANFEELSGMIHELGLQNQRAERMIKLAQTWVSKPPKTGQRYRMLHYPGKEDGKDVPKGNDAIDDEDPRIAWEIAHLPGTGAYAMDSWRIFCRDELRGLPTGLQEDLNAKSIALEMQQEWTRVLPLDKELRAYLRWRWLRLGWTWDPVTGKREKLDKEACREVESGGVSLEGDNTWALEGVVTASGSSISSIAVEESDVEDTAGTESQTDMEGPMVEQLGDMVNSENCQGNQDFPYVQAAETVSGLEAQESENLNTNEPASDNTDSVADAVTSALQWLDESMSGDASQLHLAETPKNDTAPSHLSTVELHHGNSSESPTNVGPGPCRSRRFSSIWRFWGQS